jgi:hypothetical protein
MTLNEAKEYLGEQYVLHPLYSAKRYPWHTSRSADIARTFARARARLKRLEQEKIRRRRKAGQKHLASPAQAAVVAKSQRTSRARRPTKLDVVVTEIA